MSYTTGPVQNITATSDVHVTCRADLDALRAENERLREGLVKAGKQLAATEEHWQAENKGLRAALEGVLAEADRKTAAFERAHAALAFDKRRGI